ncbi:MAG: LysR family transcriptional regulator [Deltaproteobacteria bacterium]|nr:LysR family transcriptional regulator [Deltaproteobacteria bacterium]
MDARDWEIIAALYEEKNVTKAARKLFMTQPALSLRIKNIERFFDAALVVRGNKGVQFTEQGEFLYDLARSQIKTIADAHDKLANMRSSISGLIRIGSTNYTTKYFLPVILRHFKEAYPLAEFHVITGVSQDIANLVGRGDAHVGFVRGKVQWEGEKQRLFSEKMLLVNADPFEMASLPSMPMIRYAVSPPNQEQIDRWWRERFAGPPSIAMVVDRADTCYELIAQGLGFGFLAESIFGGQEKLPHREMRYLSGESVERVVWVIHHKEAAQLKLVSAFMRTISSLNYQTLFFS